MSERFKNLILIGILICLIFIALKPTPQFSVSGSPNVSIPANETITQVSQNRFALMKYDQVLLFDFDEKNNSFKFIGKLEYSDYFSNPQNHNVETVKK